MKRYKILVPSDFTKTSLSAFIYGIRLSQKLNAKITLLHIINGTFSLDEAMAFGQIQSISGSAEDKLISFSREIPKSENINLSDLNLDYVVRFGIPGFAIADFAKDNNFDIIVMGTRDKHGILDKVLGSTSSTVLKKTDHPTIVIHESTKFEPLKKMVFAFDAKADLDDAVEKFNAFNRRFNAHTDFVHVNRNGEDLTGSMTDIIEELYEEHEADYFFNIKTIQHASVRDGLIQYVEDDRSNMLALVHREHGLFDGFFRRSMSIRMAQQLKLPVLILPE